jgi:CBS domain containing-hemolysin-like protein
MHLYPDSLSLDDIAQRLLAVVLLLAINAFFVASEFSVIAVRQSRIQQLVLAGDVPARMVQRLQQRLDRLLSTTQMGITLSSLALGWIGESTIAQVLAQLLLRSPRSGTWPPYLAHGIAVPLAYLILAYLQITLGELCPKILAISYPEQIARQLSPFSWAIARIFYPFTWAVNRSTQLLLLSLGFKISTSTAQRISADELQLIINSANSLAGVKTQERQILSNIVELQRGVVLDVMVPRSQIISLSEGATFGQLLSIMASHGHLRYPIVRGSLDQVIGCLDFRSLILPLDQGQLTAQDSLTPWIVPLQAVPEHMPLSELLALFHHSDQPIAAVSDEYGGTVGLVTLADVLGAILGDRPSAANDPRVRRLDGQRLIVQAQIDIDELNDIAHCELPIGDDYQTLGGFLIHQFQRVPQAGDRLSYNGLDLTVISLKGPRIDYIQIQLPLSPDAPLSNLGSHGGIKPESKPETVRLNPPPNRADRIDDRIDDRATETLHQGPEQTGNPEGV